MSKEAGKLTEKQRRFVEAYMGQAHGNGTEAARIAGYQGDENTLSTTSYRLLRNPKIAAAVEERTENDPLVLTREELQRWWSTVTRDHETTMKDRLRASELLGKSRGEFTDRVEGSISYRFVDPGEAEDVDEWAEEATGA